MNGHGPITRPRPARLPRGQALVEFLGVVLVLVPLFLLVPVIAKVQDISHHAQMASRYAAFEGMHRHGGTGGFRSEEELNQDVRRRFFGDAATPIRTDDAAGEFDGHRNLFWRTPGGEPLIASFGHITVASGRAEASDGVPFDPTYRLAGLGARGVHTATVTVALANLASGLRFLEPFDEIDLSLTRKTGLVADPWTSASPERTESRVNRLAPASGVLGSPLGDAVGYAIVLSELPLLQAPPPAFGRLSLWRDVVPQDRLRRPLDAR